MLMEKLKKKYSIKKITKKIELIKLICITYDLGHENRIISYKKIKKLYKAYSN
jgi:hypothetical protein